MCGSAFAEQLEQVPIDRQSIVHQFSPELTTIDHHNPFTVGNGKFAFTADITGLQSFGDEYFSSGFPLETKARWAWHSQPGETHNLNEANETYAAYGRKVNFPTRSDTFAAQWLRQNPHDLPLSRVALLLDGQHLQENQIQKINQHLDLWDGKLTSRYQLDHEPVLVESAVHADRDVMSFKIQSSLNIHSRLSILFQFPRGYDYTVKNTPNMNWGDGTQHSTKIISQSTHTLIIERRVDDQLLYVIIRWQGKALIKQAAPHTIEIIPQAIRNKKFELSVEYLPNHTKATQSLSVKEVEYSAKNYWHQYWRTGAFVDFTQSKNPLAVELQRRIILSQYLIATNSRSRLPAQETGLTTSSWYGKFHTEMAWLHNAHWILWNRTDLALPILDWYLSELENAKHIAQERGLTGARWPKMVGSDGRESPGGNPLIIWNQPQAIHLAEMYFQKTQDKKFLDTYAKLVEETAQGMSSMLTWENSNQRFNLDAPIWISQEIYSPTQSRNPTFELAYWRYGLEVAQQWRLRRGLAINLNWQAQLNALAELPTKNGHYVAMESIPDTFENKASREDHPSMLAPTAFFNDTHINKTMMNNTLESIIATWQFNTKIWGWDYSMLAIAAARLDRSDLAVKLLLMESKNNYYEINGHCAQLGADLPVYLPANASLLTAVAIMLEKNSKTGDYIGFPKNSDWEIRAEGFHSKK